MKRFEELIKTAQKRQDLSTDDMWKAIGIVDDVMDQLSSENSDIVDSMMYRFIEVLYKGHFPIEYAEDVVAGLFSKDSEGRKFSGKHWSIDQINDALKTLDLPLSSSVTDGDKLFAFNSFWHDLHSNGDSDEKIFKDAYKFYFKDEDFEGVSKPFRYYSAMNYLK